MVHNHAHTLRYLSVKDFKSIGSANVKLHPLTIVVGANSSGKSSLTQVLLAIAQAVRSRSPGARFPLNGEYARFGTFDETVRYRQPGQARESEDTPSIEIQVGIATPDAFRYRRHPPQESDTPDGGPTVVEWKLVLISDDNADSGTAKIRSMHLRTYEETSDGKQQDTSRVVLSALDKRSSEGPILQLRRHQGIRPLNLNDPSLVRTEGEYTEWYGPQDQGRWRCDTVEMSGALPDGLYQTSTLADAVGRYWWRAAESLSQTVSVREHPAEPRGVLSEDDASTRDEDLRVMVQSAVAIAEELHNARSELFVGWQWRSPIAYTIRTWLRDQMNSAEDPEYEKRLARGRSSVNVEYFLEELARRLKDEKWAQEQVLTTLDSDSRSIIESESYSVYRFCETNMKYLGPLRRAPQVLYDPRLRDRDLGLSGEYTAAVLHANTSHLVVPIDGSESIERVSLASQVNTWLQTFGLASNALLSDRGRLGIGLQITPIETDQTVDLTSVGVGVSQVLPVIVLCLLAEPGDVVILEQPELHLHPALQQQLGDFFLDCASSGRQLIVETHSEHLVNRIRRRVADISGSAEGMAGLLFAEQVQGVTTFRASAIDRFGGTEEEWPEGFFDVSAREAQALVATSLTKRYRESESPTA